MLRKSTFFDYFNRGLAPDFEQFVAGSVEDVDYINWNDHLLPMHFGDAEVEYRAIRETCGLFDGSPFVKTRVRGEDAGLFLDHLLTRPASGMASMRATYVVFCNEDGSLKDDSVLFKLSDDHYLIIGSDIDHRDYFRFLAGRIPANNVEFENCTREIAGLAVQGPMSAIVMNSMGFSDIENLKPFEIRDYVFGQQAVQVSRTGFTADLGYECWFAPAAAGLVQEKIDVARAELGISLPGYGLDATQSCRIEGGFIVAGWDCATEVDPQPGFERTPFELGLDWLVNLDAADFVGRDALANQKRHGVPNLFRQFTLDTPQSLDDGSVLYENAQDSSAPVGIVTSSAYSWKLGAIVGNLSIDSQYAGLDSAWVETEGTFYELKIASQALVKLPQRNQVPASLKSR